MVIKKSKIMNVNAECIFEDFRETIFAQDSKDLSKNGKSFKFCEQFNNFVKSRKFSFVKVFEIARIEILLLFKNVFNIKKKE